MRIAIGQINTTVGALQRNLELVLEFAHRAKERGARVAVFPELCLTGYPLRDLLSVGGFVEDVDRALQELEGRLPDGLAVVVGTVTRKARRPAGQRLLNTAVVLEQGRMLKVVPKTLLPTYDVFDERRYFAPAPLRCSRTIDIDGIRFGLTLCEDLWNDRLWWGERRRYGRDPVAEAVEEGAEVILNLSASPYAIGKPQQRASLVAHAARRWRRPVVLAAAVGGNDGLIFDGASLVAGTDGAFIDVAPSFEQALRTVDLDAQPVTIEQCDPMDELARALVFGLADYAHKTGLRGAIVGLSGGIDSALVAGLASLAFGPREVLGVAMPSRFSSEQSLADARELADGLGIAFRVIPIESAHAAYETMLAPTFASLEPVSGQDATFENVQARIRGAVLMALSNRTGRLLLTTGNKSECSVGYCTLYGDTCGGLAVIADLWKLQVWKLSRWLNEHRLHGAIPESTLTKPPSAELRPNQRDDQSLPPYEILDPILEQLVEFEASVTQAATRTGADPALVHDIAVKLHRAEYKRKQFPPTLRVTTRSWGGRDYPIAQGYI